MKPLCGCSNKLMLLDAEGNELDELSAFKLGDVVGSVQWSKDERFLVAAIKRQTTGWNLERFDIEAKTWQQLTHDLAIERSPLMSRKGDSVYYLNDRDGSIDVWRYDFKTGAQESLLSSKRAVLAFAMAPDEKTMRWVEYTANGLVLVEDAVSSFANGANFGASQTMTHEVTELSEDGNQIPSSHEKSEELAVVEAFVNSGQYNPNLYKDVTDYSPKLKQQLLC